MKSKTLHDEYLFLLQRYGLDPNINRSSIKDKYDLIRHFSEQNEDPDVKAHFQQIMDAVNELEKAAGGGVIDEINKCGIYDGTEELYDPAMVVLSAVKEDSNRLPIDIYINEFPTGDFNAFARKTNSGILCLLHTGLLKLLYHVSISGAYMISSNEEGFTYIDKEKRPREESREYIALCMTTQTIVDYMLKGNLNAKYLSGFQLDPWGVIVATSLTYSMKTFVIAHEVGHAILGHFDKSNVRRILTPKGQLVAMSQSQKEEYECDLWAQSVLLKSDAKRKTLFGLSGGGLAFLTIHLMVLHLLKKLSRYLDLNLSKTTHPSTSERIKILDSFLQSHYKTNNEREYLAPCAMLWRVQDLLARSEIKVKNNGLDIYPPDDIR